VGDELAFGKFLQFGNIVAFFNPVFKLWPGQP
jgi:hypothetical protein